MCVIIDANQLSDFIKTDAPPGIVRLREWVEKRGKIVYPTSGQCADEIHSHGKAKRKLEEYVRRGKAKIVDKEACENAAREFENQVINSNDAHILGLAKVACVTVLCTKDNDLKGDFKRLIDGGKIYPDSETYPNSERAQRRMLDRNTCP